MTNTKKKPTYTVTGVVADGWGTPDTTVTITVHYDQITKALAIAIRKDRDGATYLSSAKRFRDCETQNSDAERWANDVIGYPNPFAGLFAFEARRN
jgi:hypothetical protein